MLTAHAAAAPHEHIRAHEMGMGLRPFMDVVANFDDGDDDDWDDDEEYSGEASPSTSDWVSQYDSWLKEDAERKEQALRERAMNQRLRPSSPVQKSLGSITYVPRREVPEHLAHQTASGIVVCQNGQRYESISAWLKEAFNKRL
jgi:hypothetical protein